MSQDASYPMGLPMLKWEFPLITVGRSMPTAVLDERGRVVLPKALTEELNVSKGDLVIFERKGKDFVVSKASLKKDRLEEVMEWNPERTGKPENVSPKSMKGIWKT